MIDKFCEYLTNKIRKEMPEIDDERAEVIKYGIQLIVGELPKIGLMLIVAALLGAFWQTLIAFFIILPYKAMSGGFHLKTHIGCFLGTTLFYTGNALLSQYLQTPYLVKIAFILLNTIFAIPMIAKYAPADTINMPILRKKERKTKQILSYVFFTMNMLVALFVPNNMISNILLFGTLIQTFSITSLAFYLTKNEYGYATYMKEKNNIVAES